MKIKKQNKSVPNQVKNKENENHQRGVLNKEWSLLFIIIVLTLVANWPSLFNGFTNWDDPTYILNNPLIKELNGANIKKIFTEVYFSNYQPLHIFSYALEYHFFKDEPGGYHVVSLFMHLLNTSLVFWLVWLFTKNQLATVFTSILFGIHPMHVESIAWVAERKDLLYALFFFLTLIFYVKYIQSKEKIKYLGYAFVFFVLSIFSKTMAASLPPVLILFDFFYKRKINFKVIIEKIPFFILAIIMGLISVQASKESGSIATNESYTLLDRFFFANHNLFRYFFKLLIPLNLSAYYPYPEKIQGSLAWYYYFSPVFSMSILVLCFFSLKYTRYIFFCFGFFVITILLVLQLLPVGPAIFSERYSYIPSLGFFLLLGLGFDKILKWSINNLNALKPVLWGLAIVWGIWLSVLTYQRCAIWKDSVTLWSNVIGQFDKALHAYNNRADAYYKNGNYDLTVKDLDLAISLNPDYAMAWYNRGNAFGQLGKFKEAYADLDKAISLDPQNADAYNKRGQANAVLGKKKEAFEDFNVASRLNPSNPEIYYNIGITWINNGNKEEACKALSTAYNMHYAPAIKAFNDICK